jgi:tight adherence protein B
VNATTSQDAQVMAQLAGLLSAGLSANEARLQVAEALNSLSPQAREVFEAIWGLSVRTGGSVAASISRLGVAHELQARHSREIELSFSGPRSTARLVNWLPALGLAGAQLLGLGALKVIFTNLIALISVALACLLLWLGNLWSRSMLKAAQPEDGDPGLVLDGVRIGLEAGLPLVNAVEAANQALGQLTGSEVLTESNLELNRLAELSRRTGASLDGLLAATAHRLRERRWFVESEKVAKLSVSLMIPLGVLVLPAFVLSTITPIAISLLTNNK